MDVLNNAIELFDGSVSRKEIKEMSYRQLLVEVEHRSRFMQENENLIANKRAEKEMSKLM